MKLDVGARRDVRSYFLEVAGMSSSDRENGICAKLTVIVMGRFKFRFPERAKLILRYYLYEFNLPLTFFRKMMQPILVVKS